MRKGYVILLLPLATARLAMLGMHMKKTITEIKEFLPSSQYTLELNKFLLTTAMLRLDSG
jgi:hypothetical protein